MTQLYADESAEDDQWIATQRAQLVAYLAGQRLVHGDIPLEPEWCVVPYVALWPIGSVRAPGKIGWWAISGDVPTDYVSAPRDGGARAAMRAICTRWRDAAADMAAGRYYPDYQIGSPHEWPTLAPLLASRAELLQRWTDEDEHWV